MYLGWWGGFFVCDLDVWGCWVCVLGGGFGVVWVGGVCSVVVLGLGGVWVFAFLVVGGFWICLFWFGWGNLCLCCLCALCVVCCFGCVWGLLFWVCLLVSWCVYLFSFVFDTYYIDVWFGFVFVLVVV